MNRVNLIYNHPLYKEKFDKLQVAEKDRIFCNHTLEHFMDVGRLMYIRYLESTVELLQEPGMSQEDSMVRENSMAREASMVRENSMARNNLAVTREIIYATALMHDIGRISQIENDIPHDVASAKLCDVILPECGFAQWEIVMIKQAILEHRNDLCSNDLLSNDPCSNDSCSNNSCFNNLLHFYSTQENNFGHTLSKLLYWADKKSRNCFNCPAYTECNWSFEKRNSHISY